MLLMADSLDAILFLRAMLYFCVCYIYLLFYKLLNDSNAQLEGMGNKIAGVMLTNSNYKSIIKQI